MSTVVSQFAPRQPFRGSAPIPFQPFAHDFFASSSLSYPRPFIDSSLTSSSVRPPHADVYISEFALKQLHQSLLQESAALGLLLDEHSALGTDMPHIAGKTATHIDIVKSVSKAPSNLRPRADNDVALLNNTHGRAIIQQIRPHSLRGDNAGADINVKNLEKLGNAANITPIIDIQPVPAAVNTSINANSNATHSLPVRAAVSFAIDTASMVYPRRPRPTTSGKLASVKIANIPSIQAENPSKGQSHVNVSDHVSSLRPVTSYVHVTPRLRPHTAPKRGKQPKPAVKVTPPWCDSVFTEPVISTKITTLRKIPGSASKTSVAAFTKTPTLSSVASRAQNTLNPPIVNISQSTTTNNIALSKNSVVQSVTDADTLVLPHSTASATQPLIRDSSNTASTSLGDHHITSDHIPIHITTQRHIITGNTHIRSKSAANSTVVGRAALGPSVATSPALSSVAGIAAMTTNSVRLTLPPPLSRTPVLFAASSTGSMSSQLPFSMNRFEFTQKSGATDSELAVRSPLLFQQLLASRLLARQEFDRGTRVLAVPDLQNQVQYASITPHDTNKSIHVITPSSKSSLPEPIHDAVEEDDVGTDGVLTECWLLQIEKRLAMMRQKLATFGQTANELQISNVPMMAQLCRLETRYWLGLLPHCRRFVEQVLNIGCSCFTILIQYSKRSLDSLILYADDECASRDGDTALRCDLLRVRTWLQTASQSALANILARHLQFDLSAAAKVIGAVVPSREMCDVRSEVATAVQGLREEMLDESKKRLELDISRQAQLDIQISHEAKCRAQTHATELSQIIRDNESRQRQVDDEMRRPNHFIREAEAQLASLRDTFLPLLQHADQRIEKLTARHFVQSPLLLRKVAQASGRAIVEHADEIVEFLVDDIMTDTVFHMNQLERRTQLEMAALDESQQITVALSLLDDYRSALDSVATNLHPGNHDVPCTLDCAEVESSDWLDQHHPTVRLSDSIRQPVQVIRTHSNVQCTSKDISTVKPDYLSGHILTTSIIQPLRNPTTASVKSLIQSALPIREAIFDSKPIPITSTSSKSRYPVVQRTSLTLDEVQDILNDVLPAQERFADFQKRHESVNIDLLTKLLTDELLDEVLTQTANEFGRACDSMVESMVTAELTLDKGEPQLSSDIY